MVRRIPKELGRDRYFKLGVLERRKLWANIVAEHLGVSEDEARRMIERNNKLPEWEVNDAYDSRNYLVKGESHLQKRVRKHKVYPRFNANASLLARLSADYRGPRGPRPIFASLDNIARISFDGLMKVSYWRHSLGRNWEPVGTKLIDLKLSASDPKSAPDGVRFTYDDIRRGVYIAPTMDTDTAGMLGVIYSDGHLARDSLRLTFTRKNLKFYTDVVMPKMDRAFNLLQDEEYEYTQQSGFSKNDYSFFRLNYGSTALTTYLANHFKFRKSEEERRKKGLSKKIKGSEFKQYMPEFLKFYLGAASRLVTSNNCESITIGITDVSGPMLEDIGHILGKRLERPSLYVAKHKTADTHILRISTVPLLELFFDGMLDENPTIRNGVNAYLQEYGIGKRAFNHLYNLYGDEIAQYKRK